jgi:hypothetical protein
MVEAGAAIGLTEAEMCLMIVNPNTYKPIDLKTLRLHFRDHLDRGHVAANVKVGAGLFKNATTPTPIYPGGNPICQLFWMKCRLKWRQNHEGDEEPPPPTTERAGELEIARRIWFVLDRPTRKKPAPKAAIAAPAMPAPVMQRKREVA